MNEEKYAEMKSAIQARNKKIAAMETALTAVQSAPNYASLPDNAKEKIEAALATAEK